MLDQLLKRTDLRGRDVSAAELRTLLPRAEIDVDAVIDPADTRAAVAGALAPASRRTGRGLGRVLAVSAGIFGGALIAGLTAWGVSTLVQNRRIWVRRLLDFLEQFELA